MRLEDALAICAAYPPGVEAFPRPTQEQQRAIDDAKRMVRIHAFNAIDGAVWVCGCDYCREANRPA